MPKTGAGAVMCPYDPIPPQRISRRRGCGRQGPMERDEAADMVGRGDAAGLTAVISGPQGGGMDEYSLPHIERRGRLLDLLFALRPGVEFFGGRQHHCRINGVRAMQPLGD